MSTNVDFDQKTGSWARKAVALTKVNKLTNFRTASRSQDKYLHYLIKIMFFLQRLENKTKMVKHGRLFLQVDLRNEQL